MVSILAPPAPQLPLGWPIFEGEHIVKQTKAKIARIRKLLLRYILLLINVVSCVIFWSGVPLERTCLVLAFGNEMMLCFQDQQTVDFVVVLALGVRSFKYTNVDSFLAPVVLDAGFDYFHWTLGHQIVGEPSIYAYIVNGNELGIVNERSREIYHERKVGVMDDAALFCKDFVDLAKKSLIYTQILKSVGASSFDEFSSSNLRRGYDILILFTSGLTSVLTVKAITTYMHTDRDIFFDDQSKRTEHVPPEDKADPHSKNRRHSSELDFYLNVRTKPLSIVLEQCNEKFKPTSDGFDEDRQIHQNSESKNESEELHSAPPKQTSKHSKILSRIDEKLEKEAKPTPEDSGDGSQRQRTSGGSSKKSNTDPEGLPAPATEEEKKHSPGRDDESQRHKDSGGDSKETNDDPEDPPPSPPEDQSKHSSDLFSTGMNKEASQAYEFLRFSLKRDSYRRYPTEFHLEPSLKIPRMDYDFEALDPKGFPFTDHAQYAPPPHLDVPLAPFPTTGAHLLATVRARMHYEVFRLGTFLHLEADHPFCLRLANAGFFYTFQGRMIQCYSCGLRWDDWRPEQDFYAEHQRRRPECLHVQGKDTSNVPIHEGQSRFRSGADITGENIDKSSSAREILRDTASNLQRALQEMVAMRQIIEISANFTLGSTAALNTWNKNAVETHFSEPQTNAEEILNNSGNIITASAVEKEQSRPSERQEHNSGAPLTVASNLHHGDRLSSKSRASLPQREVAKTLSPPAFNSNSLTSSNNNEVNDDDDGNNNYNSIINNIDTEGAAKEKQSPAMTRAFVQHLLPDGAKAQGVAMRTTEQRRQEEASGNDRAQLPLCSPDASGQVQPPENPRPGDRQYRSADGQIRDAEPIVLLPDSRSETLKEPRDTHDCRREPVAKVSTTNDKHREAIGQHLVGNFDQHQRTTSHGGHQNAPLCNLNIDPVNDIDDESALFATPNTLPGSSKVAGAGAVRMPPSVSSSESTQHLCNGEAEPHALGQSSTSNSRTNVETSRSEDRVEITPARSYHAQNSDQPSKSGGAIPKTTDRQVTSSRTSDGGQRESTKPTASEEDASRRKPNVKRSPSSVGKYGAGENKIINTERREDTGISRSSRTYVNGEVDARPRRTNSSGTPNPESLFATAQLMNSSANSRPAVVNGVAHSTSAVPSNLPLSGQKGQQDGSQQELKSRESNVQSRESPLPEIQRVVPEERGRDVRADSMTSSTQLNTSVVNTKNSTQPQPSLVQRSEPPHGVTASVSEAGQARDEGWREGHPLPGHSSGIPNGVTRSVTEPSQNLGTGRQEGYQLRGPNSGIPNGTTITADVESHRSNVQQPEEHPASAQSPAVPNGISSADGRSERFNVPRQDRQQTSTRTSTPTSQTPPFNRESIRAGWAQDGSGETSGYQTLPSGHGSSFLPNINQTTNPLAIAVYNVVEANRPSLPSVSDPMANQTQASASPASGYDPSKAKYPYYHEPQRRRESFAQWPHHHQDPEDLVDAGFFFAGAPDCVRCFHCGLGLKDWEAEDDPFEEHARWRASCAYLAFFREEEIRARRQALLENRPVGNAFHMNGDRGGQGPVAAQVNLAVTTQPARAMLLGFQGEDWMTSPAAQWAREMGFLDDAIQYAIVQLLRTRAGRRAVTPQNLVQAILYIRERNENARVANNSIGYDDGNSDDDSTENFFVSDDDEISNDSGDDGEDLSATAAGGAGDAPASEDNNSIVIYNPRMTKDELKKLEEENKELQERMRCKVCLDSRACVLFVPCRHRVCCVDCAARLRKCPMCRRAIRGSVPIAT